MKIIELDLTGCEYLGEIHERIRTAFEFPEWYGNNWSAFWDMLWSECDADRVIVIGTESLSREFGEAIDTMIELLKDKIEFNKKCGFKDFSYEIL